MFNRWWGAKFKEISLPISWDEQNASDQLTISGDRLTLCWETDTEFAWLPAQTTARLHGGIFLLDFQIDSIENRQTMKILPTLVLAGLISLGSVSRAAETSEQKTQQTEQKFPAWREFQELLGESIDAVVVRDFVARYQFKNTPKAIRVVSLITIKCRLPLYSFFYGGPTQILRAFLARFIISFVS